MARPCLFCAEKATTKEHIIPKWIAKEFGLQGAFLGATTKDARQARKQDISFKSHRKKFFCECCQKHFKLLEDAVIPLITPMGHKRRTTLSADDQRLIARWTAKTGFGLIASEPGNETVVPEWQRYGLRESDRPPEGVWVGVALYQGLAQKDVRVNLDESRGNEHQPRSMYSGWLSFASVGFKAFGVDEVRLDDQWSQHYGITQFWPPLQDTIEWPPHVGVRGNGITAAQNLIPLAGYDSPIGHE